MVRNIEVQNTFSGPLDLLLYLVRRDEIDIHDIPVGHVTREYLSELNKMQEIDVDAGGEFLAMASMLTEIKGRMLLPDVKEEDEEEDEIYDPRQGLVEALLEYKKFKEVAAELESMSGEFSSRFSRQVKEPEFKAVVKEKAEEMGALDLLAAFQRIARKMLNERAPREIVSEEVPTEVRIKQIEEVVSQRGRASFTSILSDSPTEDEMVGFFIAMLELIRMRKIEVQQAIDFSEIYFIPVSKLDNLAEDDEEDLREESYEVTAAPEQSNKVSPMRLSSAFNLSGLSKPVSASKDRVVRNRFDTFSNCRSVKVSEVKPAVKPNTFPPLIRTAHKKGESMVDEMEISHDVPEEIRVSDKVEVENDKPNISMTKMPCQLSEIFKMSDRVCTGKGKRVSGKKANTFDMLLLKKIISDGFTGVKKQPFLRMNFNRIDRHNNCQSSVGIVSEASVAGEKTVAERDRDISIVIPQITKTPDVTALSDIFKMKVMKSEVAADRVCKFDFLTIAVRKNREESQRSINSQNRFLSLPGRGNKNNAALVERTPEQQIDTNPVCDRKKVSDNHINKRVRVILNTRVTDLFVSAGRITSKTGNERIEDRRVKRFDWLKLSKYSTVMSSCKSSRKRELSQAFGMCFGRVTKHELDLISSAIEIADSIEEKTETIDNVSSTCSVKSGFKLSEMFGNSSQTAQVSEAGGETGFDFMKLNSKRNTVKKAANRSCSFLKL